MRKGTTFDSILAAVWEQTDAVGPYGGEVAAVGTAKVDWSRVLVGDRLVAMIFTRIATYGADYAFTVQCRNPACRRPINWEIDLIRDVPVKPFPEEALRAFTAGNKLTGSIGGRAFTYRLMTGADEVKHRNVRSESVMTDALAARITGFDGVHPNDRVRHIEDLDMADVREVFAVLEASDGGVDTDLEVQCAECSGVQEVALPFGRDFFLPGKAKKSTRS